MSTPAPEPISLPATGPKRRTFRALKELGEVMVPVSLVALLAQAFSLSATTTATISLYVVIVLYTWLYRDWLNGAIRSAIVILVIMTLALAASFLIPLTVTGPANVRPAAPKDAAHDLARSGIIGYGERANDWAIPQVPGYAEKATHDIWYVGVDFHISSSQHQELVLKRLAAGVNVRFLFYDFLADAPAVGQLNPTFPELVQRFDYQSPQLLADLTSTVENLRKLQSRWTNTPTGAKLEIRLYRALPWARAYLFDPSTEHGTGILVNYIYGKDTSNLPAFLVRNTPGGLLPTYLAGIQALWDDGTDFRGWLPLYDRYKTSSSAKGSNAP